MVFVSARNAFKNRLALAIVGVDMPARKALLRTIGGGHKSQCSASFFQLVAENNFKAAPSLFEDRTVEPGFGSYVAARFPNGPFGAGRHVFDFQIFKADCTKVLRNIERLSVLPVAANTRSASLQRRNTTSLLGVTLRAALASRQHPLRLAFAPVDVL